MNISTKGLYAVRFMVFLAKTGDGRAPVPLKAAAESLGLSHKYLEQIAAVLTAAQLLRSVRGAQGGYRLARSASRISLLDVLSVTEGSLAPVDYLDENGLEAAFDEMGYEVFVWKGLHELICDYLGGISLLDMVEQSNGLAADSYSI